MCPDELLAFLYAVKRWLGNKDMPIRYQAAIVAEKESEQDCADMGTVLIGIGEDDDFMVFQAGFIEGFIKSRP